MQQYKEVIKCREQSRSSLCTVWDDERWETRPETEQRQASDPTEREVNKGLK